MSDKNARHRLVDQVITLLNDGYDDPREAVETIIERSKTQELRELGQWALYNAYKEKLWRESGEEKVANDEEKQSRYEGVDPLNLPKPIDKTGETKTLKNWTLEDVKRRLDFLKKLRSSIDQKIEKWESIKTRMKKTGANKIDELKETSLLKEVA